MTTSEEFIDRVMFEIHRMKLIAQNGQRVRTECATAFGIEEILCLEAGEPDFVRMEVFDSETGEHSIVLTKPYQFPLKFSHYVPTPKGENREIVVKLFSGEHARSLVD